MDDELTIQTARLGMLAESLREAAKAIETEVTDLHDSSSLMLDGWTGDAALAYRERQQVVTRQLQSERDSLLTCAKLATGIENIYATADVELARIFGDEQGC